MAWDFCSKLKCGGMDFFWGRGGQGLYWNVRRGDRHFFWFSKKGVNTFFGFWRGGHVLFSGFCKGGQGLIQFFKKGGQGLFSQRERGVDTSFGTEKSQKPGPRYCPIGALITPMSRIRVIFGS